MGNRKNKAKRSLASLPKGLPQQKNSALNPFEVTKRQRRSKHDVLNRFPSSSASSLQKGKSRLALSLQRRQTQIRESIERSKKANSFVDKRIGEYTMTHEEQMLARLVKERSRRSKRATKYQLGDDDDDEGDNQPMLTHKGKAIDDLETKDHVILSSDEEDGGNLDAVETELHFGGMRSSSNSPYGPLASSNTDMAQVYSQRKTELDDLIARRKTMKAEKALAKERQVEAFETMDDAFKDLSQLLQFRDKEKEYQKQLEAKRKGELSKDDEEMAEWDKEMKQYLFERRVKATDRTKTPEEIAKEESDRLQELETRRLARMNGDFEDDDLSDISDVDEKKPGKKKRRQRATKKPTGPDALDDSDSEGDSDELKPRFTADGLIFLDKEGNIVKKAADDSSDDDSDSDTKDAEESEEEEIDTKHDPSTILPVGTQVRGNYRAKEQFDGNESWYDGKITAVHKKKDGTLTYDVEYNDGDFEEDMEPQNVIPTQKSKEEKERDEMHLKEAQIMKRKRQKAKEKARQDMPFVFEVPTTLETLHNMIATHASTGQDVSLIISRIHASNSVRLNKRNQEKMQNFLDVLLRRFIAVGDAIHSSGNGGTELGRYDQLDSLTKTLYGMAQDSPDCSAAVWSRRLGILQNAHAKRLRDAEFIPVTGDEDFTAWPSIGIVLLLRALGHIFPVTDLRHRVVTPALLLLGQMVSQTPVRSLHDVRIGLLCSGLLIEFTREAKRVVPEALAFAAGVIRMFSPSPGGCPVPNLQEACTRLPKLRHTLTEYTGGPPQLSLEKEFVDDPASACAAILWSALHLVEASVTSLHNHLEHSEKETFAEIADALLALKPMNSLPKIMTEKATGTAKILSDCLASTATRSPLTRRAGPSVQEKAIHTLAPRVEDSTRYSMSKDKKKSAVQVAIDRTRREYKREHKAISRELRLDASFTERERRRDQEARDNSARAKRHKNFAWLEGEQAAMNQQVRQGGGLLSGGGMGAARAKARSAKMGYKKGGKL